MPGAPPPRVSDGTVSAPPSRGRRWLRRLGTAAATFVLVDLLGGMVAFSLIVLGTLTFFGLAWIRLAAEYARVGLSFGTSAQLLDAYGLAIVGPTLAVVVIYLARSALRLPGIVWRHGMTTPAPSWTLARRRIGFH